MIWIKTEEVNMTVTDFYLHTIGNAFEKLNQKVIYSSKIQEIKPLSGDIVVVSTAPSVLHFLKKNIKVIYWAQGAWPEESLMRHSSKIRFAITSLIEKKALKRANYLFFVSDCMRKHFEKKYKISFANRYYLMPCANESFHKESFFVDRKYSQNVFCYAGATSVWQCFEETICLYSKIEEKITNSKLLLLVKDKEYAEEILKKYDVKNYEIDFVSVDKLPERLKSVKYGFLLRKTSVVNEVATPTKTLTYLSNGIIPIYGSSLRGINEILNDCKYKVTVQEGKELDSILEMIEKKVDPNELFEEFYTVYRKHYDANSHADKIALEMDRSGIITV